MAHHETRHIPRAAFLTRPRSTPPQAAVVDALSGIPFEPHNVHDRAFDEFLPLSLVGPGTAGSLVLVANLPAKHTTPVVPNACGTLAMELSPWHAPHERTSAATTDGEGACETDSQADDAPPSERSSWTVFARVCPVCLADSDDPFHFFFICPAAQLRIARLRLFEGLPRVLRALIEAARGAAKPPRTHLRALKAALRSDWDTAEGRAIAFRLLCGFPFPARAAPAHEAPLAHALGMAFDAITGPPATRRAAARAVVAWAAACTMRTAAARRAAMLDVDAVGGRQPADSPESRGWYVNGATITAATHDPNTYIRWRLAHYATCHVCTQAMGGAHTECARCDVAVHDACVAPAPLLPGGAEWVCHMCAVTIAQLAEELGDDAPLEV